MLHEFPYFLTTSLLSWTAARYAEILSKLTNRSEKVDEVQRWAIKMWKGPRPLLDLMRVDSAQMLVKENLRERQQNQVLATL